MSQASETHVMDVLFHALRDPVPYDELSGKVRELRHEDWQVLATMAIDRHRVGPRVWSSLKSAAQDQVPADFAARMEADTLEASLRGLKLKRETAKIVGTLNARGIRPCLLKGWPLEEALFGQIGQRVMHDLDLMISPQEVSTACAIMKDLGYVALSSNAEKNPEGFLKFMHHLVFLNTIEDVVVEIHTRLFRNERIFPISLAKMTVVNAKIGHKQLSYSTLSQQSNFLYLVVHGYLHGWERAKWLIDLPPLWCRMSKGPWLDVQATTKHLGLERVLGVALVLCRKFLKAEIPEDVWPSIRNIEQSFIVSACRRGLLSKQTFQQSPTLARWLDRRILEFRATSDLRAVVPFITAQIVRESDVSSSELARRFAFIHYVRAALHFPERIGRHVLRTVVRLVGKCG